jgi:hypothetical protein
MQSLATLALAATASAITLATPQHTSVPCIRIPSTE